MLTEGEYIWSDGNDYSYTNWNSGEPDGSEWDCIVTRNGLWADRVCTETNDFICLQLRDQGDQVTEEISEEDQDESETESENDVIYKPVSMFDLIDGNNNNEISRFEWFGMFTQYD